MIESEEPPPQKKPGNLNDDVVYLLNDEEKYLNDRYIEKNEVDGKCENCH